MPSVLITGANRGLGLEFARQYAEDGWRVLAMCRDPANADALKQTTAGAAGGATIHALDVEDFASIDRVADTLSGEPIDVLINNAGIMEQRGAYPIGKLDYAFWEREFRVNTFAPAKMAQSFVEHVARSERRCIVTLTSGLASLELDAPGKPIPPGDLTMYRATKAAANMLMRNLAADLRGRGIVAVAINPGHTRTAMGGPTAPLLPEQSIRGVRAVIDKLDASHSGRFYLHNGQELPW